MRFKESETVELKKSTSELKEAIISIGAVLGQQIQGKDCIIVKVSGHDAVYSARGRESDV